MHFRKDIYIPFHFVDGAGILFFGKSADIFHEAYETFLLSSGKAWKDLFQNPDFAIPIKSYQVEFMSPCIAGKTYNSQLAISKLGNSSFEVQFRLLDNETIQFQSKSTHVFLCKKTLRSITIPDEMRAFLTKYLV